MSSHNSKDNPEDFPWLSRKMLVLENPKTVERISYGLYVLCGLLFLADFLYKKKYYVSVENIPGFYALFGVFMGVALVLAARSLRVLTMKKEDYYAPKDVETEAYPEDQLERDSHV